MRLDLSALPDAAAIRKRREASLMRQRQEKLRAQEEKRNDRESQVRDSISGRLEETAIKEMFAKAILQLDAFAEIGSLQCKVELHRFPCEATTDRGRAINQPETGWEATLQGDAKSIYDFFMRKEKKRGFRLYAEVEFSGGFPDMVVLSLGC